MGTILFSFELKRAARQPSVLKFFRDNKTPCELRSLRSCPEAAKATLKPHPSCDGSGNASCLC